MSKRLCDVVLAGVGLPQPPVLVLLHCTEHFLHAHRRDRDYLVGDETVCLTVDRHRGVDAGRDAFEVFITCQDHVVLAASAHVDRRVAEAFAAGIAEVEDDEVKEVLGRLCALHCLDVIERERGWFQEHGRLSGERAKAVTATVNELCGQLRPAAGTLVDAFGIPDEVLGVLGPAESAT